MFLIPGQATVFAPDDSTSRGLRAKQGFPMPAVVQRPYRKEMACRSGAHNVGATTAPDFLNGLCCMEEIVLSRRLLWSPPMPYHRIDNDD